MFQNGGSQNKKKKRGRWPVPIWQSSVFEVLLTRVFDSCIIGIITRYHTAVHNKCAQQKRGKFKTLAFFI